MFPHVSAPAEPDIRWHRGAATFGPVTLRVAYQVTSSDALFELVANQAGGARLLEGTGNLTDGIHAHLESTTGTITLRLFLDEQDQLRYHYERTSACTGQLRSAQGTIASE
jgi:hypothetical protein